MNWCKIYLRSFAPWKDFAGMIPRYTTPTIPMGGGPYHGDGRKFSTGTAGVTSRISSYVTLNYAAMVLAQTKVWSDISIGPWMMVGPLGVSRATPQMSVTTYALPTMGAY